MAMVFKLFTHIPQKDIHFTLQPSNIYMCILTYKRISVYIERKNIISVGGGALIFFIASFFYKCLHDPQIEWVPIGLNNVEVIGESILECCEKEVD